MEFYQLCDWIVLKLPKHSAFLTPCLPNILNADICAEVQTLWSHMGNSEMATREPKIEIFIPRWEQFKYWEKMTCWMPTCTGLCPKSYSKKIEWIEAFLFSVLKWTPSPEERPKAQSRAAEPREAILGKPPGEQRTLPIFWWSRLHGNRELLAGSQEASMEDREAFASLAGTTEFRLSLTIQRTTKSWCIK